MLGGTFTHNVDDKGRVVVPAQFKKDLGADFIITMGYDDNLMVMPFEDWKKFLARFDNAPISKTRWIRRRYVGNMSKANVDKQGRMQIPQPLREKVGLEDEAVLVGNGNMFEIWSTENWDAVQNMLENDKIIESMDELMF